MEMQDFWTVLVNALLFFLAYKIGQMSILLKIGQANRTEIEQRLAQVRTTGLRPIITVEEIDGIFYAYDGNDFLAQGNTADELGKLIAKRYPNKYHLAKVEYRA